MSEENIEVVKAGMEAFAAGDMDALRSTLSQDVLLDPLANWPEADEVVGREAVIKLFRDMLDGFERVWHEASEIRDLGDDKVLVESDWCGVPLGGHVGELRFHYVALFKLKGSQVTRIAYYSKRDEALEAAG